MKGFQIIETIKLNSAPSDGKWNDFELRFAKRPKSPRTTVGVQNTYRYAGVHTTRRSTICDRVIHENIYLVVIYIYEMRCQCALYIWDFQYKYNV